MGTYNLTGGSLSVGGNEYSGNSGSGTFTNSGGTDTVTDNLSLGHSAGGSGTYTLSAGSLAVGGGEYIGDSGSGIFTQSGGSDTVSGTLSRGQRLQQQRHLHFKRHWQSRGGRRWLCRLLGQWRLLPAWAAAIPYPATSIWATTPRRAAVIV